MRKYGGNHTAYRFPTSVPKKLPYRNVRVRDKEIGSTDGLECRVWGFFNAQCDGLLFSEPCLIQGGGLGFKVEGFPKP